jgi:hypothetical protein
MRLISWTLQSGSEQPVYETIVHNNSASSSTATQEIKKLGRFCFHFEVSAGQFVAALKDGELLCSAVSGGAKGLI